MEPYRITSAILITYSGKRHPIKLESEFITKPLRIIKESLLDTFSKMCENNGDPFVRIEVRTEPLFKERNNND